MPFLCAIALVKDASDNVLGNVKIIDFALTQRKIHRFHITETIRQKSLNKQFNVRDRSLRYL